MPWLSQAGPDVLIRVKAVPGASRDQIAGPLGDRLKIRVAAPPEGGKANEAICQLIAKTLGVGKRAVSVESGPTNPEKSVRACGVQADDARAKLAPE
jgi:uncharacterized protein (TIGR00251 family)